MAAAAHVLAEVGRGARAGDVQVRNDDEPVAGKVRGRADDVGRHVLVPERSVVGEVGVALAQGARGVRAELEPPPARPVEHERDVCFDPRARDLPEAGELGTEFAHFPMRAQAGAAVRQHRRVVLLGAAARLPPLEVENGVGAAGDRLIAPQAHHSRRLRRVSRPPVDRARRLLQQQPRRAVP